MDTGTSGGQQKRDDSLSVADASMGFATASHVIAHSQRLARLPSSNGPCGNTGIDGEQRARFESWMKSDPKV